MPVSKIVENYVENHWENPETDRVVKSSRLPAKIATYLVSIGRLLFLAFLYGRCLLNKISQDWPLTLTTQPSTLKLSDNPEQKFKQAR